MKKNNLVLNLVIPCYNEEEALPLTKKELDKKMGFLARMKTKMINSRRRKGRKVLSH